MLLGAGLSDAKSKSVMWRRCGPCPIGHRVLFALALCFPLQAAYGAFWGYLPLDVTGSVTYGYGYFQSVGAESETTTLIGNLNASGYIWQPWFASTSAAVSLGFSSAQSSVASSDGTATSGAFSLDVFPRSRFPFSLNVSISDSETESFNEGEQSTVGLSSRTMRLTARQTYRGRSGSNYSAWYSQSDFEAESVNSKSVSYGMDMRGHRSAHQYSAAATYSGSETSISPSEPVTQVVSASHVYTPSPDFGVTSILTYVDSDSGLDVSDGGLQSIVSQGASSFFWRPEHRSFNIRGGARLSEIKNDSIDGTATQRALSTNLGASYNVTRALRFGAAATVSSTEDDGLQTLSSTQSVDASYSSQVYEILGFNYNWNTSVNSGNTSVRTDSESGGVSTSSVQSYGGGFGHSASQSWRLGGAGSFGMTLGQSVSGSKSTESDRAATNLNHSMGFSVNHRGRVGSTYGSVRFTDSRAHSMIKSNFQQLTVTASEDIGLGPESTFNMNVTYQASRSTQEDEMGGEKENTGRSVNGAARYSHSRPFGIYNLRFFSRFVASKEIGSEEPSSLKDWDNRLDYSLGLLSAALSLRISESAGGARTKSLYFRATRSF